MRFEEALAYARKGKKIRRKAWGDKCYIEVKVIKHPCKMASWQDPAETFINQSGNIVSLNTAIFEKDWQVITCDWEYEK